MKEQSKYDVFISYSRKDFKEVNSFIHCLKESIPTLTYWFDLTNIECGDEDFEERIITAIDQSKYVLFFLSDNSMKSPWIKDEVMYAKNKGKKVIPVLLKGTKLSDGWFLYKFGRVDCIDSTNSLQVEKLLRNLSQWTNKPIVDTEKQDNHPSYKVFPLWLKYSIVAMTLVALVVLLKPLLMPVASDIKMEEVDSTCQWVDLGLSVMWASCNIGADLPEQMGDYYAWGETEIASLYTWDSYIHGGATNKIKKYCNDAKYCFESKTDNLMTLEAEDDVATMQLGNSWRIPTIQEMEELRTQCSWKWINVNGVNGYQVIAKNGNSIFLPAAGSLDGSRNYFSGEAGFYWCSNLKEDNPFYAYTMGFNKDEISCSGDGYRLVRRSIRPVYQNKQRKNNNVK